MSAVLNNGSIIIPRPIHELGYHVLNLEIPSLQLLVKAVKTAVCSIWRWHLYDTDAVIIKSVSGYITDVNGTIENRVNFVNHSRLFILKASVAFAPDQDIKYEIRGFKSLALASVMAYYRDQQKVPQLQNVESSFKALWSHFKRTYGAEA